MTEHESVTFKGAPDLKKSVFDGDFSEVKTYTVIRSTFETVDLTGTLEEVMKIVADDMVTPHLEWDPSSDYTYNYDVEDDMT